VRGVHSKARCRCEGGSKTTSMPLPVKHVAQSKRQKQQHCLSNISKHEDKQSTDSGMLDNGTLAWDSVSTR